jgi:molybdenum cofactor guanylyltransferase
MTSLLSASQFGLVLAGGRSSRFGSEKAAAMLEGRPLLAWTLALLDRRCAAVAVSARPGSQAESLAQAGGRPVLHDLAGDAAGPLAGIRAGLVWAADGGAELLAAAPCDTPRLPADLHERLLAGLGTALVAMPQTQSGPQPLCALWRVEALLQVEAALAGGAHPSVWRLIDSMGGRRVPFEDAGAFANINHPADLG